MAQHQNLECLLEGRIDAMLVGSLAFHSIERNLPEGRVRVDPTPVSMFYNRIGFSPRLKNVEALRDLVENRIQELRVSGELQEIFRYYGINP
jgi:polar amino acid transport system substrate-binding protein